MIDFGAEIGGMDCQKIISPYKRELLEIFYENDQADKYFFNLECFLIVLRVSGKTKDFGGDGPDRLEKLRGKNIIGIDLLIPKERWENKSSEAIREYLAHAIQKCFYLLLEKAVKLNEVINEDKLVSDFEFRIKRFLLP